MMFQTKTLLVLFLSTKLKIIVTDHGTSAMSNTYRRHCLQTTRFKADINSKSKYGIPLPLVHRWFHGEASQRKSVIELLLQAGVTE